MALDSMMKWDLHKMDVNTTFLNGMIEEEVYIKQPQGFEVEDKVTHVCKLKKALYGLKKAPLSWYGIIDRFLAILGFNKSKDDPNLSMNIMDDEPIILLLYVVYLVLIGNGKQNHIEKEEASRIIRDAISCIDALFCRFGSVEYPKRNLSEPRKVCSRNLERI